MPILPFLITILFFIVINLFLALFLSSLVVLGFKLARYPIETAEMSFLIFLTCAALWIGMRVIWLNFYRYENFADLFIWPISSIMPKDIIVFLNTSTGM
jgi:hypothetical protein